MRLIRCRKCGAALVTEDALIERMNDTIHELNEKARHSKNGKVAKSYLAEAASVTKMMKLFSAQERSSMPSRLVLPFFPVLST